MVQGWVGAGRLPWVTAEGFRNTPYASTEGLRCAAHKGTDLSLNTDEQEAGVSRTALRQDWPPAVLLKVLAGLSREAPRQLLQRELWAGSASAASWWRRQHLFATSTAVMSMVRWRLPCTLMPVAPLSTP